MPVLGDASKELRGWPTATPGAESLKRGPDGHHRPPQRRKILAPERASGVRKGDRHFRGGNHATASKSRSCWGRSAPPDGYCRYTRQPKRNGTARISRSLDIASRAGLVYAVFDGSRELGPEDDETVSASLAVRIVSLYSTNPICPEDRDRKDSEAIRICLRCKRTERRGPRPPAGLTGELLPFFTGLCGGRDPDKSQAGRSGKRGLPMPAGSPGRPGDRA